MAELETTPNEGSVEAFLNCGSGLNKFQDSFIANKNSWRLNR